MTTTPYPVAARELLRDTLLDAAHGLLEKKPWASMTMAEIARAAGVSRQTLYNEFGSRPEFAQAYVLREGDRFLTAVESAIAAHHDDAARALQAAFDVFLRAASEDPVVRAVVAGAEGSDELLPFVTTRGRPLLQYATSRLADAMVAGWPLVDPSDALMLSECLVRLAISHAALPEGPAGMDGAAVMTMLGPYVREVTSRAAASRSSRSSARRGAAAPGS